MYDDDALIARLKAMPQAEPPPGLHDSIMESVRASAGAGASRRPARIASRVFLGGWAVAAVIILLFLVFARPRSDSHTSATMAPLAARFTSEALTLESGRNGEFVTLTLIPHREDSITIRWAPESAKLVAISGASATSSGKEHVSFPVTGASRVELVIRPAARATSLNLQILSKDEELLRPSIRVR